MPDQHLDVTDGAITDGATGNPILTKEDAQRIRDEWTAQHPPLPGLRWVISFNMHGEPVSRRLEVIPGWEDAFAPSVASAPHGAARRGDPFPPGETDRLGALAYQGWQSALPERVRQGGVTWDSTPELLREPLRQAAVLVWQHGENAGFHEALLRTLPAGQLGAAGELENICDLITAHALTDAQAAPGQNATPPDRITVNLKWLREQVTARVRELRRQASVEAKRERDARRHR